MSINPLSGTKPPVQSHSHCETSGTKPPKENIKIDLPSLQGRVTLLDKTSAPSRLSGASPPSRLTIFDIDERFHNRKLSGIQPEKPTDSGMSLGEWEIRFGILM